MMAQRFRAPHPDPRGHVHARLSREVDFVLIELRTAELYARGHVPGAINIPHAKIIGSRMAHYPAGTLFVVYCSGPHCNGAQRGAIRLARLGWLDEGFAIERGEAASAAASG
jgi:rhodanese-related sulfurtransferase